MGGDEKSCVVEKEFEPGYVGGGGSAKGFHSRARRGPKLRLNPLHLRVAARARPPP